MNRPYANLTLYPPPPAGFSTSHGEGVHPEEGKRERGKNLQPGFPPPQKSVIWGDTKPNLS